MFPSLCRFGSLNYLLLKIAVTLGSGTLYLCKTFLLGNPVPNLRTHVKTMKLHFKNSAIQIFLLIWIHLVVKSSKILGHIIK